MFSVNKHFAVITDTDEILNASKSAADNLGQVDIAAITPNLNLGSHEHTLYNGCCLRDRLLLREMLEHAFPKTKV